MRTNSSLSPETFILKTDFKSETHDVLFYKQNTHKNKCLPLESYFWLMCIFNGMTLCFLSLPLPLVSIDECELIKVWILIDWKFQFEIMKLILCIPQLHLDKRTHFSIKILDALKLLK